MFTFKSLRFFPNANRFLQISYRNQKFLTTNQFKVKEESFYPKRENPKPVFIEKNTLEHRKIHVTPTRNDKKNYYSTLGILRNATLQEIKKAYYLLAKKYHPDATKMETSTATAKKFQAISEAYQVLSDDKKRLEYDLYGFVRDINSTKTSAPNNTNSGKNNNNSGSNKNSSESNNNSGNKKSSSGSMRNQAKNDEKLRKVFNEAGYEKNSKSFEPMLPIEIPEEIPMKITFLQSVHGTSKEIVVKTQKSCTICCSVFGSTYRKKLEMCKNCKGSGVQSVQTLNSIVRGVCKVCNGTRYIPHANCLECKGRGYTIEDSLVKIPIPSGVTTDELIYVNHPNGKQKLAIRIQVMKSLHFVRNGNDILSEAIIPLSKAVLGGTIKIRGIHDEIELKIVPGTESHTKIHVNGKGIRTKTGRGDHIVTVKVKIPKDLSPKQKELMNAFADVENEQPYKDIRLSKMQSELAYLVDLNKKLE